MSTILPYDVYRKNISKDSVSFRFVDAVQLTETLSIGRKHERQYDQMLAMDFMEAQACNTSIPLPISVRFCRSSGSIGGDYLIKSIRQLIQERVWEAATSNSRANVNGLLSICGSTCYMRSQLMTAKNKKQK